MTWEGAGGSGSGLLQTIIPAFTRKDRADIQTKYLTKSSQMHYHLANLLSMTSLLRNQTSQLSDHVLFIAY